MVLIEHVGFGGRERQVWLYWWDERNGGEWSGWWMTPDFIGNNEYFMHQRSAAPTPSDAPVGSWRSPFVEEQQFKRMLEIGFKVVEGTDGFLQAYGGDAATPFIPDQICKVNLSLWEFRPAGVNHGKPAYQAYERPAPAPSPAREHETKKAPQERVHPAAYVVVGVALGLLAARVLRRR
jgi:hypothetical protein